VKEVLYEARPLLGLNDADIHAIEMEIINRLAE